MSKAPALVAIPGGKEWPAQFEWVPLAGLFIDERYQRPPSPKQIKETVDDFNPLQVGTLAVCRRRSGQMAVVDGQHRFLAMRQLGYEYGPCMVADNLELPGEALLFSKLQRHRLAIRPVQRFRAELVAEVARAVDIDRVLASLDIEIADVGGKAARSRSIAAVASLENLWKKGGADYVERVLLILDQAWQGRAGSLSNEMLKGLDYFLSKDNPNDDKLVRHLSTCDPQDLIIRASHLRQGRGQGGGSPSYMAEAIRLEYARRGVRKT